METKEVGRLKKVLKDNGYSQKAIDEISKWYE
jgi:hypothetical protein